MADTSGGVLEISSPPTSPPNNSSSKQRMASASAQLARRPQTARGAAAQDTAILGMMKRQMEALEDKLSGQISKVEKHGNQQWNNSLTRVESKMGSIEQQHPRINNKMAELSGGLKVVSDEMQAQIRRTEQVETRLWDRCRQIDEEVRFKISALEQSHQQISSSQKVGQIKIEDVLKKYGERLARLELLQEERQAQAEDAAQGVLHLHSRLAEVEDQRCKDLAERQEEALVRSVAEALPPEPVDVSGLEEKLGSILPTLDYLQQELVEIRQRVNSQEERFNFLRANTERGDERLRALAERVECENCASRLKELNNYVHEVVSKKHIEYQERLEVLASGHSEYQCQFEALKQAFHRLQETQRGGIAEVLAPSAAEPEQMPAAVEETVPIVAPVTAEAVAAIEDRVSKYEERLEAFGGELELVRGDMGLAPRVTTLIKDLKDLAPKVISHELSFRELQDTLKQVDAKAADSTMSCDQFEVRLTRMEQEVERLRGEIEGLDEEQDGDGEAAEALRARRPSATE